MSKNKSRYAKRPVSQTSRRLMEDLAEVEDLIERKRWQEALNILEPLEERYPERAEVLLCLLMVYGEQEAAVPMLRVALKLARVMPREPEVDLALASAYTMNFHVVLALDAFHRFLQRWPNHPEVSSARQSLAEIEQHLDAHLAETGFTRDELELARWFDEAEVSVEQDRIPQALATYQKLLNRKPDHAPALINISRLHALEGRYDQAIAAAQRALVSDPEHADAHANLVRFLCVTGRADEARQHAEQLKLFQSGGADGWILQAEVLSYLGDDQGVLDAFNGAEQSGVLEADAASAWLHHFAASACLRLGQEKEARQHWRRALKLDPGLTLAEDNLNDLKLPVGERHTPWPFTLLYWVSTSAMADLAEHIQPLIMGHDRKSSTTLKRTVERFAREHAEIVPLLPILLDRGDPAGRELALLLAEILGTPETLQMLRAYAMTQRGPDDLRRMAAQVATQAGLLPDHRARLWTNGEWQDVLLFGFEVHGEPVYQLDPRVKALQQEAHAALRARDAAPAIQALEQALQIEPDLPPLLNDLATAYRLQKRPVEAEAIYRRVVGSHPDNVIARSNLAQLMTEQGKLEEARRLLDSIVQRQRLHYSELAALCIANIELNLTKGEPDAARSWLSMWEEIDPDDSSVALYQVRLGKPPGRWFRPGRRK